MSGQLMECPGCLGTGEIEVGMACDECGGNGRVPRCPHCDELLAALKWIASQTRHKTLCAASGTLGPDACSCGLKVNVHDVIARAEKG